MIDTHCHMDLYPDPSQVAREALKAGVGTIVVTNLPSAFERAYPFVGNVRGIKLALGLHPLVAEKHADERARFLEQVGRTRYIGEVGLDFSPQGIATKETQIESFRFVLRTIRSTPKFMTVHSRRAESAVLEAFEEEAYTHPVVFHWFSGPMKIIEAALAMGHYFSVNPAMKESPAGRRVIERLPGDRVLLETDGPFVRVGQRAAHPNDVSLVRDHFATVWQVTAKEVEQQLHDNFFRLRNALGGQDF